MKFNILVKSDCGHWHIVKTTVSNVPMAFDNPALANETAKRLTQDTGKPHRIQAIKQDDNAWKVRENDRFIAGEYETPPWDDRFISLIKVGNDRFPHMSKKHDGKIAFTQNANKGQNDIQTTMSIGRYLQKYHWYQLHSTIIADLSALCGETGFSILTETDDIVSAFENGPRSCMKEPGDFFHGTNGIHPTSVYGHGKYGNSDLGLAILRRDGEITARCVVWPEKMLYNTIYGDRTRMLTEMANVLPKMQTGSMVGAKLNRIPVDDTYVCAYLDGESGVNVMKDYLEITCGGEYTAEQHLAGTLSESGCECTGCGGNVQEDEQYHTEYSGDVYCETCYYETFGRCENCEGEHYSEDLIWIDSASVCVCDDCAAEYPLCDDCGERHSESETFTTRDGDTYCQDCINNDHTVCDSCCEYVPTDEIKETDDNNANHCADCYVAPDDDDDDDANDKPKPSTDGSPTITDPSQQELSL